MIMVVDTSLNVVVRDNWNDCEIVPIVDNGQREVDLSERKTNMNSKQIYI